MIWAQKTNLDNKTKNSLNAQAFSRLQKVKLNLVHQVIFKLYKEIILLKVTAQRFVF